MRVSLAIAFTVAVVFVAARPVDVQAKGFALREQTALLRRDEGPTSGKQNNNDTRTSQASPPANDSRPPPNSQPGASSNSDHPPAKSPEPERGSGDNRVDPPQHNSDDGHAGAREQPRPQAQPQSQPKDERNDVHDGGNNNSNGNSNSNNNGQSSGNSNANANSNNSNGRQEESRPKGDNQGPRPDNNSRPVHEHFEQVQTPGGNPNNVDRLTHDVVNDDRNGVHTNIVQRVSVSGNNVNGQVTDRVVQGGNGVFVNGRGNTIVPPSFMNPTGPNGPNRGNRQ
ncbi:hypothetical protein GGI19_001680 [Coemansia pectinata]|uniref:Uncharacterized protein n=1 Tax=Coemansia pectinata TaxID=1052879 RepID=A0A9W8H112_9FUNG|nr:hypothetical protein GGI19_001680 [Coemansia pectinata]